MRDSLRSVGASAQSLIRRHNPDYRILTYTIILVVIGLIIIFAIGPQRANVLNESFGSDLSDTYFVIKQASSVLAAVAAFVIAYRVSVDWMLKRRVGILLTGFGACILLVLLGNILHVDSVAQCALGACRWFVVPGLGTIQPAEILKFGLLIYLAGFLAARMRAGLVNDRDKTIIPVAVLMAVAALFVIVLQKDLGTGIAMVSIIVSMFVVSGMHKQIGIALLAILAIVGLLVIITAPHRIDRVTTFLKGDDASVDDPSGYHIAHAKIAIGSGGALGVGIGNSVQAAGYLPEAINDSVFAILGETFGFAGLVFILAMFYLLLVRILGLVDRLEKPEYRLIVAGVFGWIASHVIINVAAMTGLMPLTGITLPFLSFGGTSMVFIAAALGVVFQISRYTVHTRIKEETHEDTRGRRGVGRPRYASRRSR